MIMIRILFMGASTIILSIQVMRQAIRASRNQSSRDDDRFVYTFFVAVTFALLNLGVI